MGLWNQLFGQKDVLAVKRVRVIPEGASPLERAVPLSFNEGAGTVLLKAADGKIFFLSLAFANECGFYKFCMDWTYAVRWVINTSPGEEGRLDVVHIELSR